MRWTHAQIGAVTRWADAIGTEAHLDTNNGRLRVRCDREIDTDELAAFPHRSLGAVDVTWPGSEPVEKTQAKKTAAKKRAPRRRTS